MKKQQIVSTVLALSLAVGISVPMTSYAGEWKSNQSGWWWYQEDDGTYPSGGFKEIDGKTYSFTGYGYMETGWKWVDGFWYYFDGSGAMAKNGWLWIGESCYYFYEDGHMAANENIGGSYVNGSGAWVPDSWKKNSQGWWYQYGNGSYPKGEMVEIQGKTYFFNTSGYMETGWKWVDGLWYYFDGSGAMAKNGWLWIGESCYYFYEDGRMAANEYIGDSYVNGSGVWVPDSWKNNSQGWWYQYGNGSYPKGEMVEIQGKTYSFDASGYMETGWKWVDDLWYYFDGSGAMVKNRWLWIGESCYYFYEDGHMAANEYIGQSYVDETGAWASSPTEKKIKEGSLGFFKEMKAQNAITVIEGNKENFTTVGDAQDATSLENMKKALEYLQEFDLLRRKNDLPPLAITDTFMAIAQVHANHSSVTQTHSLIYNVYGENLSFIEKGSSTNIFRLWFDEEKANFDEIVVSDPKYSEMKANGSTDYEVGKQIVSDKPEVINDIGRYLNLINPHYKFTGFALTQKWQGQGACDTYSQVFDLVKYYGDEIYTLEDYTQRFMEYYNSLH